MNTLKLGSMKNTNETIFRRIVFESEENEKKMKQVPASTSIINPTKANATTSKAAVHTAFILSLKHRKEGVLKWRRGHNSIQTTRLLDSNVIDEAISTEIC